jgi:aldehyde dehydrogenase (NAD+)
MEASTIISDKLSLANIDQIYALQQQNIMQLRQESVSKRKKTLRKLLSAMYDYREEIRNAIYKDCKRNPSEVDMTEIYPVIAELKHAIKELHRWLQPHKVKTPLALAGSSSKLLYEPKGHVLIISPWNFPVNLTLGPLVSALAAGNAVLLKPSEFSPNTSRVLKKIIEDCFESNHVALVEGDVELAQHLLSKKFDHIFFTGSPAVGKIVMKAASEHLASVTLELGGKSPTIVDESADINKAAKRIIWGKFANNGQICIAPDYVLVHESKKKELIERLGYYIKAFYSDPEKEASYSRIINQKHFKRLKAYLEDAVASGGEVAVGGKIDGNDNYIAPTLITNIKGGSMIMEEEIFGPLLPILSFSNLDELLRIINSKEKPLALYIFSRNQKNIDYVIHNTMAGATCINHNAVHFYNTHLPFGGVNNSGIGKSHGFAGFSEFSNARAVFRQHVPNALELLVPPYNSFKQKLIDLTLKYF